MVTHEADAASCVLGDAEEAQRADQQHVAGDRPEGQQVEGHAVGQPARRADHYPVGPDLDAHGLGGRRRRVGPVGDRVGDCLPQHDPGKAVQFVSQHAQHHQVEPQLVEHEVDGRFDLPLQRTAELGAPVVVQRLGPVAEHLDERLPQRRGGIGQQVQRPGHAEAVPVAVVHQETAVAQAIQQVRLRRSR